MPELEALTDIRPTSDADATEARQFVARFPLAVGKTVRLGQAAAVADWAVPEDNRILPGSTPSSPGTGRGSPSASATPCRRSSRGGR